MKDSLYTIMLLVYALIAGITIQEGRLLAGIAALIVGVLHVACIIAANTYNLLQEIKRGQEQAKEQNATTNFYLHDLWNKTQQ